MCGRSRLHGSHSQHRGVQVRAADRPADLQATLAGLPRNWPTIFKGTILLSTEGINLFIAGQHPGVEALVALIRSLPGLADLAVKES